MLGLNGALSASPMVNFGYEMKMESIRRQVWNNDNVWITVGRALGEIWLAKKGSTVLSTIGNNDWFGSTKVRNVVLGMSTETFFCDRQLSRWSPLSFEVSSCHFGFDLARVVQASWASHHSRRASP